MNKSLHYWKINKRVVTRLWDTLDDRSRDIIADDVNAETPLAQWFKSVVASETQSKYENPDYWMNTKESFAYPQREDYSYLGYYGKSVIN